MPEFVGFDKIPRLNRDIIITEKLDGTNAQIVIDDNGDLAGVGSRNRWITPGKSTDNYGFAGWVHSNLDDILKLGPGQHFGEWWGQGIARHYGLKEKRFSLFNTHRWGDEAVRPACCGVVPVLYDGMFDEQIIKMAVQALREKGSVAAPGFMSPEGIIVYHKAADQMFKVTLDNDGVPKGAVA